jgi:hypothetical protein
LGTELLKLLDTLFVKFRFGSCVLCLDNGDLFFVDGISALGLYSTDFTLYSLSEPAPKITILMGQILVNDR